jgi:glycosyltransferase involved in cell wall biosynthesis
MTRRVQIVVPCFNEAERLDGQAFLDYVRSQADVGILFVDDGSTDGTRRALEGLAAQDDGIGVHVLEQNSGKAEAVRQGVLRAFDADPEIVGYLDADLATPLDAVAEIRALLDADPEVLLAMGSRVKLLGRKIERSKARHYIGRVFATLASTMLGLSVYDTQCGAKLFRVTPVTREIFSEPFMTGWVFDVELMARLQKHADGERVIREHPLRQWLDVAGSKVRFTDGLKAGWDLLRIGWRYR